MAKALNQRQMSLPYQSMKTNVHHYGSQIHIIMPDRVDSDVNTGNDNITGPHVIHINKELVLANLI